MNESSTLNGGLDVQRNSINIATADARRHGKVRHTGSIGGDLVGVDTARRKLVSKGFRQHVPYEAGPCAPVTRNGPRRRRWSLTAGTDR